VFRNTQLNSLHNFHIVKSDKILTTKIPRVFDRLEEISKYPEKLCQIAFNSVLSELLIEIYNICSITDIVESDFPASDRIASVIDYINLNLSEDLSLDKIAKEFYISKFYLSKIFKANTGSAIGDFIIKKRLVYAKHLINGGSTPGNACIQSGFSDYSSFYKNYKKYFGVSPSNSL